MEINETAKQRIIKKATRKIRENQRWGVHYWQMEQAVTDPERKAEYQRLQFMCHSQVKFWRRVRTEWGQQ